MKKLTYLLMCLSACAAHADSNPDSHFHSHANAPAPFTGLYMSVGFGGTTATIDNDQNIDFLVPGLAPTDLPAHQQLYGDSVAAVMEIGYAYQFRNHFVLGGAITANYSNVDISTVTNGGFSSPSTPRAIVGEFDASLTNDFAILFKPGYVWGKTTEFYGLLGPRWGNFHTSTAIELPVGGPYKLAASDSEHGYQLGITAGAGIKQMMSKHWSLGLEYAYTSYGEISAPSAEIIFPTFEMSSTHELKASTNTIMLTLSFKA